MFFPRPPRVLHEIGFIAFAPIGEEKRYFKCVQVIWKSGIWIVELNVIIPFIPFIPVKIAYIR